jgi:hypothetical protein
MARKTLDPADLIALMSGPSPFDRFLAREELTVPPPPDQVSIHRLRLDLKGSRPPIWRRLELAGDLTLDQVHDVIQVAMGWYDGHLHAFRPPDARMAHFLTAYDLEEGERGLGEHEVRLDQVLRAVGDRLFYEYDFGDDWEHVLKLEAVRPRGDEPPARCLGGKRRGPLEDCGGIYSYNDIASAITSGDLSELPPHLVDWLPEDFDPAEFDAADVDAALARCR